jgi:ATP-dependent DNA helicase PIF1
LQCIDSGAGGLFFLNGPGGTGTTFVYQAISHAIRGQGKIVLCVASSGIASILLPGGHTSHSCFNIPLDVDDTSHCSIPKNGLKAELLKQTVAIIWDEVPMQHRYCMEAVDRTLKDVLNSNRLFGGIVVLWGGDFRQILPVVEKGNREDIVYACIQHSYLWQHVHIFHLTQNMWLGVTTTTTSTKNLKLLYC